MAQPPYNPLDNLSGNPADEATANAYYQALLGRDARFDGCFFTGVTSTGIYCRPVCKVRVPMRKNCRFFAHAAQAESAGFRPCMRCRPELAPHSLVWSTQDASHTLALQAAHLFDTFFSRSAVVPTELPSLDTVAQRLGVSDRHLRRIFEAHIGVSPLQYLQTRRLLCAKQLLTDTRLPMGYVALASGFASLRRFNAALLQHYRLAPTQLRKGSLAGGSPPLAHDATKSSPHSLAKPAPKRPAKSAAAEGTTVQLAYRPPYDASAMLNFWRKRQLYTIELVAACANIYWAARTFSIQIAGKTHAGWLRFSFDPTRCVVQLQVSDSLLGALPAVIARTRAALDLDANPAAINAILGPHFAGMDGLRVPGSLDGFEVAVRAIAGQQVTIAAGRTLVQRLVGAFGSAISTPYPELSRLFPSANALAQATPDALGALGFTRQRQAAILAVAQAVSSGALDLNTPANALATIAQLKSLPGIGDWTAQYIAMRALRWPDAFPAGDVALHNALGLRGEPHPARAAEAASQAWRPWRSYAVLRAWQQLEEAKA